MAEPRRFGRYDITTIIDGVYRAPIDHLHHASSPALRDGAVAASQVPTIDMDVNFFVLSGPDGITLVDAGTGPHWGPELGLGWAALETAGVGRSDVRRVLITHLHGDHALGLFGEAGRYFPEAEIIVPEADLAFFTDAALKETVPTYRRGGFEIAARLVETYGDRVRAMPEGPVADGIEMVSMPGHSPGHSGYLIGEGAEKLLLWGDLVHAPGLQLDDPDFCFIYDSDAAQGAASRRRIFVRASEEGWIASGGHVTGFVRMEKAGTRWRFVPA
ncbi:AidB family quorum-quenching N-acyl homoserine lactonase [Allorhizobium taibaishanense]|uniref:Glyoxylase-like metal-dependent hydrolase (Beta-lactamase superfamily II) n=1 Tax=Allorhizobium taibaishanense TaxID=887144 RepID=A0A1Q9A4D7_9HYPH|nr:MBL fold metallo-hydrolase [Allorhizobium taibaishanense]MBB4006514.1 glyoxylase-like metal-dependent hydrolase (beta-lactamase superfamily II) [Allorhizobium taibaishanense]OLP49445.1 MBL fold metallo-hydrolase [Allorhizobium taibaishanense]